MPALKPVFSSHIAAIGYEDGMLVVQYKTGRVAHYSGVPPDVAERVLSAPSVGEAMHAEIRGKYDHTPG